MNTCDVAIGESLTLSVADAVQPRVTSNIWSELESVAMLAVHKLSTSPKSLKEGLKCCEAIVLGDVSWTLSLRLSRHLEVFCLKPGNILGQTLVL